MNTKLCFGISVLDKNQCCFYLDCMNSRANIWFFVTLFLRKNLPWVHFLKIRFYMRYPPYQRVLNLSLIFSANKRQLMFFTRCVHLVCCFYSFILIWLRTLKTNTFYKLNLFEVTHRGKFQVVATISSFGRTYFPNYIY